MTKQHPRHTFKTTIGTGMGGRMVFDAPRRQTQYLSPLEVVNLISDHAVRTLTTLTADIATSVQDIEDQFGHSRTFADKTDDGRYKELFASAQTLHLSDQQFELIADGNPSQEQLGAIVDKALGKVRHPFANPELKMTEDEFVLAAIFALINEEKRIALLQNIQENTPNRATHYRAKGLPLELPNSDDTKDGEMFAETPIGEAILSAGKRISGAFAKAHRRIREKTAPRYREYLTLRADQIGAEILRRNYGERLKPEQFPLEELEKALTEYNNRALSIHMSQIRFAARGGEEGLRKSRLEKLREPFPPAEIKPEYE